MRDISLAALNTLEPRLSGIEVFAESWISRRQFSLYAAPRPCSAMLLVCTDMRIGEIAGLCGFADPLYFARLFTRQYGASPRAYRARCAGEI